MDHVADVTLQLRIQRNEKVDGRTGLRFAKRLDPLGQQRSQRYRRAAVRCRPEPDGLRSHLHTPVIVIPRARGLRATCKLMGWVNVPVRLEYSPARSVRDVAADVE